ncbi:hypothetical protein TRFO_39967 [Tritrichomonas foetus]|uniref:USP domain-containing protein n=1 Tax=Tritrichomonas foetus TaxID=1144522 RepID=A0A1J4J8K7_9EUKA|nr:hypothetical protein TRFO_39967 [Tritrichomonas foetus]|eukprot:OHS93733.1 hypothetical protein TRFO_39967 [Tritrichomonas foetus]
MSVTKKYLNITKKMIHEGTSFDSNENENNDVDFEVNEQWIIQNWKVSGQYFQFEKNIDTPTNTFRCSHLRDVSSNFTVKVSALNLKYAFPLQIILTAINHQNPTKSKAVLYNCILTPSNPNFLIDFQYSQSDLIIEPGFFSVDQTSLTIDINMIHKASNIHPTQQPETFALLGLCANPQTFHLNNLLVALFMLTKFKITTFLTNTAEGTAAYELQNLYSLLHFRINPLIAASTKELVKSLCWHPNDYFDSDFLNVTSHFFENILPIQHIFFTGKRRIIQKCTHCDFSITKNEEFLGINLPIHYFNENNSNSFDDKENCNDRKDNSLNGENCLENSLNSLKEKKNILINAGDFGEQEAFQYYEYDELPPVLFINIQRFTNNSGKNNKDKDCFMKDNSYFSFPSHLNFGNILSNSEAENNYDLFAVMAHSGKSIDGHFYTYIKLCATFDWYLFDDSKVLKSSEFYAMKSCFGSPKNDYQVPSAYFLIYVKTCLKMQFFDDIRNEHIPERIQKYPTSYIQNLKEKMEIKKNRNAIIEYNLITPKIVEENLSHGKLSFDDCSSILYVKPTSTFKTLYERASEALHISTDKINLWACVEDQLIKKIENTDKHFISEIDGVKSLYVHFLGQELTGEKLFLVVTYFHNHAKPLRLMFNILMPNDSTFHQLFDYYCDICHCPYDSQFVISYRISDYDLSIIDDLDTKVCNIESSIINIQPENTDDLIFYQNSDESSNIINSNVIRNNFNSANHNVFSYYERNIAQLPFNVFDYLRNIKESQTLHVCKDYNSDRIFLFNFPLCITFKDFKNFVSSTFSNNCSQSPFHSVLLFEEMNPKPLFFSNNMQMGEILDIRKQINTLYLCCYPFLHQSCITNLTRLVLQLPDHSCISHIFRDETTIFQIIKHADRNQWLKNVNSYQLVKMGNNGKIKYHIPLSTKACEVKNPISFVYFHEDQKILEKKERIIPVEIYDANNKYQKNFLLKIIPEEILETTISRIEKNYGNEIKTAIYKIYLKNNGEAELDNQSVLYYEDPKTILRVYIQNVL